MARRYVPVMILVLLIVLIQLVTSLFNVKYYLTQLTMSAYYALVIIGLCLLMGYAGQISIGQAGFFAIGGYTTAALTTANLISLQAHPLMRVLSRAGLLILGKNSYGDEVLYVSPWVACLVAIFLTLVISFLIGMPVLKLKGHYLAMATLGFGTIIYRIVIGSNIFGGADGLTHVPAFTLLPGLSVSGDFSARVANYYIAWAFVTLAVVIAINLINSRVGRGLRALHGGEEGAGAMGVDTARYKLNIFVLSAVMAAVGGIFLTHYNGGIGPSETSIIKSVRYVAIVAAGGMASLWGTLITGMVLNFLSLRGVFGTYDDAVFGVILILIMVFAPGGLLRVALFKRLPLLRAGRIPEAVSQRDEGGHVDENGE
ncbi:MAG TPA: branched-chain amino acid ABC transporter permease [Spirochaetia bacterium]|nr:branched-chain amino acid ABC transporter permease [Spirochaetia bacterium]